MTRMPLDCGVGQGKMMRLTRPLSRLSSTYSSPLRGRMRKLPAPAMRAISSANTPAALTTKRAWTTALAGQQVERAVAIAGDPLDRAVHQHFDAVDARAFDQREADLVGVDHAGGGRMQARDDIGGQRRLLAADALPVPDLKPADAAFDALRDGSAPASAPGRGSWRASARRCARSRNQARRAGRPTSGCRPIPALPSACQGRVVAGMDDAAVRLAGAEADFAFLFDQDDPEVKARQGARDGAADHPSADNGDIVQHAAGLRCRKGHDIDARGRPIAGRMNSCYAAQAGWRRSSKCDGPAAGRALIDRKQ